MRIGVFLAVRFIFLDIGGYWNNDSRAWLWTGGWISVFPALPSCCAHYNLPFSLLRWVCHSFWMIKQLKSISVSGFCSDLAGIISLLESTRHLRSLWLTRSTSIHPYLFSWVDWCFKPWLLRQLSGHWWDCCSQWSFMAWDVTAFGLENLSPHLGNDSC